MNCPSCGGVLSASHRFCQFCGTPVNSLWQEPQQSNFLTQQWLLLPLFPDVVGGLISSDALPVGGFRKFLPPKLAEDQYHCSAMFNSGRIASNFLAVFPLQCTTVEVEGASS
jgi:hypothetical protein